MKKLICVLVIALLSSIASIHTYAQTNKSNLTQALIVPDVRAIVKETNGTYTAYSSTQLVNLPTYAKVSTAVTPSCATGTQPVTDSGSAIWCIGVNTSGVITTSKAQ